MYTQEDIDKTMAGSDEVQKKVDRIRRVLRGLRDLIIETCSNPPGQPNQSLVAVRMANVTYVIQWSVSSSEGAIAYLRYHKDSPEDTIQVRLKDIAAIPVELVPEFNDNLPKVLDQIAERVPAARQRIDFLISQAPPPPSSSAVIE